MPRVNASLITGLDAPTGIALLGSDLFVGNFGNGTVGEYTLSGATINASLISGLDEPFVAASGSYLYVANEASNTVGKYKLSGAPVNSSLVTGLDGPTGISVSGSDLFVTNEGGDTVGEFNTTTGAAATVTCPTTSLSGGGQSGSSISVVSGTAVTDQATLSGNNAASATGTVTYSVYSDPACTVAVSSGKAESITTPGVLPTSTPVTLDTSGTYYWQAKYSGDDQNGTSANSCGSEVETIPTLTVSAVSPSSGPANGGTPITITGTDFGPGAKVEVGDGLSEAVNASLVGGLDDPYGIAVSGSDIFVTNEGSGTVGEYTTSGATVNASLITGLDGPTGIAVSGSDIFVSNFDGDTVGEYTTSGTTVNASLVTGLDEPFGIAVSGSDLFVTNYRRRHGGRVHHLGSHGQRLARHRAG